MRSDGRRLDVHLGVDGVFENVFDRLFAQGALNAGNSETVYISADIYKSDLRQAVDGAATPTFTFPEDPVSRNLLISRPRMLFPGVPMNCGGDARKLVYKLEHLQHIFSGRGVTFHLFLTDHISYLFNHQKFLAANPDAATTASWQPLVNAIRSHLRGENALQIWNAEEVAPFLPRVLTDILGIPENKRDAVLAHPACAEPAKPTPIDMTKFAETFGLDQEHFDFAYEEELRQFFENDI